MMNGSKGIRGFSLVELLVAMAIGLILMAGVVQIFIANKGTYLMQREQEGIQESARFALHEMTEDLRMVGYGGCGSATKIANSVDDPSGEGAMFQQGIVGFHLDKAGDGYPARGVDVIPVSDYPAILNDAWPGTDAFQAHNVGGGEGLTVTAHNPNAATIHFDQTHSYKPGTIMIMASEDCSQIGVFAMSGPTNNSNNATTIVHNTGTNPVENCTKFLGGEFTCVSGSAEAKQYGPGSSVLAVESSTYFIRNSGADASTPALYRLRVNETSAEELVPGVEGLRVLYGLDTDLDAVANQYLLATEVDESDWPMVVAVRLILDVRSIERFEGDYLRQRFTTTVQIRNRG
ncbi:PilW family protein [Aestuariirhabdus litorea]|uniref:Prepilin-type N-terminal cleavage/methylation domain-containing protein n=1 Tax=Aestuariirhabdus litorea TaxID=2528527 RepID=A0A3P3VIV0_9GAMM|nr:PilW family protein [Aestuariirhabdus litorea]RRJ82284.1 prepilin-type N-terminal cleavage/methylation domain-containing protein [Aestuariirhabdus litorea]RWW92450.1 prepilin-type N-terminal cleavage/methylation domain-containing protein [Endozoicomonadaceae bacterium GTF-13]